MSKNEYFTEELSGNSRTQVVLPDLQFSVEVCGSLANIGSGYDCFAVSVDLVDTVSIETTSSQDLNIDITGHGASDLPRNESHLLVQGIDAACSFLGVKRSGLNLCCHNRIPQARGLGSSAATFTCGLFVGSQMSYLSGHAPLSIENMIHLGGDFEGHADNSSASLLGGAIVSWRDDAIYRAAGFNVHPDIQVTLCIPETQSLTATAREKLSDILSRDDCVFNISRAGLLPFALMHDPTLLFAATDDAIHQKQRRLCYAKSYDLLRVLRDHYHLPACIGGAGPCVAIFHQHELHAEAVTVIHNYGFDILKSPIGHCLRTVK